LPAIFIGNKDPSLKDDDASVKGSAAWAVPAISAMPVAAATTKRIPVITFLLVGFL
jgi:hypothetical protein